MVIDLTWNYDNKPSVISGRVGVSKKAEFEDHDIEAIANNVAELLKEKRFQCISFGNGRFGWKMIGYEKMICNCLKL